MPNSDRSASRRVIVKGRGGSARSLRARAFTLIELLCVVAVLVILISLLAPALRSGLGTARTFKCQVNLRGAAFDFAVFADDQLHGNRGADNNTPTFRLETFMESQYEVDEFWSWGDTDLFMRPGSAGEDPMRCSEVSAPVSMRRATPCRLGAVGPAAGISFGFNMRLHQAEVFDSRGRPRSRDLLLTSAILQRGRVPLVWDVDGEAAARVDRSPVFSAPALDSRGVFARDAFWFPTSRHLGSGNYALIDGSVHTSNHPLTESGWDWAYQSVRK